MERERVATKRAGSTCTCCQLSACLPPSLLPQHTHEVGTRTSSRANTSHARSMVRVGCHSGIFCTLLLLVLWLALRPTAHVAAGIFGLLHQEQFSSVSIRAPLPTRYSARSPVCARTALLLMSHSNLACVFVPKLPDGQFDVKQPPSFQGLVGPQEYLHFIQRCNHALQRDFRWRLAAGLAGASGLLVALSLLLIGLLNSRAERQAMFYIFLVFGAVFLLSMWWIKGDDARRQSAFRRGVADENACLNDPARNQERHMSLRWSAIFVLDADGSPSRQLQLEFVPMHAGQVHSSC